MKKFIDFWKTFDLIRTGVLMLLTCIVSVFEVLFFPDIYWPVFVCAALTTLYLLIYIALSVYVKIKNGDKK